MSGGDGRAPSGQALLASLPEPVPVSALPGDDPSREMFFNRKEVAGVLAMWAVRQSPYPVPDRLAEAVQAAHDALPEELEGWFWATEPVLRELVEGICLNNPIIATWNVPASGHDAPFVFSSRYDSPSPDDDFIDLHALANNICRTLIADQQEYFSDSDGSPQGGDGEAGSVHDGAGRETASPGHRPQEHQEGSQ